MSEHDDEDDSTAQDTYLVPMGSLRVRGRGGTWRWKENQKVQKGITVKIFISKVIN